MLRSQKSNIKRSGKRQKIGPKKEAKKIRTEKTGAKRRGGKTEGKEGPEKGNNREE